MFALIESGKRPRQTGSWTGRALSLGIHAALVTAAIVATRQVARADHRVIIDTTVIWQPPARRAPACDRCARAPSPPGMLRMPSDPLVLELPHTIPDPGPAPGLPGDTGGSVVSLLPPGDRVIVGTEPLAAAMVDEPPVMVSHPEPRYPEVLRQAGMTGQALIEAVIDTLGRAERTSLVVRSSTHPLFAAEAEAVVLGSRYRPGRVDGRAVRVRIAVPVSFSIGGR